MSSFDQVVTPTSAVGRHDTVRNTSARATRGRSTTRRFCSENQDNLQSKLDSQEPRKLNLSPGQQQNNAECNHEEEIQLLTLPPSLFPHWCMLMLCSSLCLAATAAGTPLTTNSVTIERSDETNHYENHQMAMAIATLSLMLTFLASACYVLIPAAFVGTLYEVTMVCTYLVSRSSNCNVQTNSIAAFFLHCRSV